MIDPGQMDQRVRFEVPTQTQDAYGGAVKSWALHREVWARVTQLSGTERRLVKIGGESHHASLEVWVYRADYTPQMRIVWNTRVLNILHIKPQRHIGGQRGMVDILQCETGKNNG